ncbi:nitrate reductase [Thioalkalivibrio versutus]|uniref:Nitrate reductase n=1 Tax=Thioalkalivibrio versutus TaxID=106634 RepID=A0A0G3FZS8_9GAMM|nr:nitrate reductase [Thioalkalivibrio versutus]AKJ94478.1 nitrate reductase [Thioalkalivibrio versutus]
MATSDAVTRTTCPYCGVGCGVEVTATPRAEFPVAVRGDASHPANAGRLCSKGAALAETLGDEGRLLHPEIEGVRVDWDAALDHVAGGFRDVIDRYGPDAVALYVSGQILTEDYFVANKLMKGFVGSANIDTNSRLCMSTAVAAHTRAFGMDGVPGSYTDFEQADLVVVVGSNMAWAHPVLFQRLQAARAARPEMKLVVIDPRCTATAQAADLHLPLAPGTDAWLFNGLLDHLRREDALDPAFLERHVDGFADALAAARASSPSIAVTAETCELAPEAVATFFRWFARTERTVTAFCQGINQSDSGVDKAGTILNVHLATGRIGRPGMGPFSLTGQPNAMGGREVGGLASQLAAHMGFDEVSLDRVSRFWNAPNLARNPGLKALDLFRAVESGQVKAIWIIGTNPLFSLPEAERFERALRDCPLVVVSDCVRETETTRVADVLLPATTWGEKDGTVTNSERRISRQRPFREPPGEARHDWWALAEVARRLGFAEAFPYTQPVEIFREHAALSAFENDSTRDFDIGALAATDAAAFEALEPVQWPLPAGAEAGTPQLYADGRFFTANGRARLAAVTPQSPTDTIDAEYPLRLNTGRIRDQWHSMTRTASTPRLSAHQPEPFVEIHPVDAGLFRAQAGDLAEVTSRHGRLLARVQVSREQRPGSVFVPMHWSRPIARLARVDALVPAHVDPVSGQPAFKHTAVSVRPAAMDWHGFVLSREPVSLPEADYAVTARGPRHLRFELAGRGAPPEIADWRARLDGPGEWLEFADPAGGRYRAARIHEGRLACVLFAGPDRGLPEREWLGGLFAAESITDAERMALLTGRPPNGQAARGRLVCACFGVDETRIRTAIREHGLATCEAVGACLEAGTNCGSCRPEIQTLLNEESEAPTDPVAREG